MPTVFYFSVISLVAILGYGLGNRKAVTVVGGRLSRLHSVPSYHGFLVAMAAAGPPLALFIAWRLIEEPALMALALSNLPAGFNSGPNSGDLISLDLIRADILNVVHGIRTGRNPAPEILAAADLFTSVRDGGRWLMTALSVALTAGGLVYALGRIDHDFRARNRVETAVNLFLIACSLVAILTTIGIVLSLVFEALRFFTRIPVIDFLLGLQWSPQTAIRADQVGSTGAFGAVPLFLGTLAITNIAMVVAVPVGLMAAIYMSEYADRRVRAAVKPILEILAGIPTVVYGFFAALTMAPLVRDFGHFLGLNASSESALAAGLVMGVMIIPFVSSLSDDVINAVPQSLRDGSYGLGATKSETIRQVVLPAALPGIVAAVMLAVSRAIGETMIVTMAAGLAAQGNLWDNFNPLNSVTTVTTQIATLLVGDQEFDSPKTLAAFGLGLVLFLVTLALNIIALRVVQKYREKYD